MTASTSTQLVRFLLVGGSTVCIDLLVYRLLLPSLDPSLAKGISFLCGTIFAYQANRVWTFKAGGPEIGQLLKFLALYGTNLGTNVLTNMAMLAILPMAFGLRISTAFVIATGASALLNFLGMKFLVFSSPLASPKVQPSSAPLDRLEPGMPTLSLILPCYNEADNLPLILHRFAQVIDREDVEVVLVNNGSTDHSAAILTDLLPHYPFARVVNVEVNQGYGFGILAGLQTATGRFLGWTHADMQTDPKDVLDGLALLERQPNPQAVYVKGLRRGRPPADTFFTVGMSGFATLMLGVPLWDINAQPNLFSREFFATWHDPPFDFSLDLYCYCLARRQRLAIARFPVEFGERAHGVSKWNINWKSKVRFIRRTIDFTVKLRKRLKRRAAYPAAPHH